MLLLTGLITLSRHLDGPAGGAAGASLLRLPPPHLRGSGGRLCLAGSLLLLRLSRVGADPHLPAHRPLGLGRAARHRLESHHLSRARQLHRAPRAARSLQALPPEARTFNMVELQALGEDNVHPRRGAGPPVSPAAHRLRHAHLAGARFTRGRLRLTPPRPRRPPCSTPAC